MEPEVIRKGHKIRRQGCMWCKHSYKSRNSNSRCCLLDNVVVSMYDVCSRFIWKTK